MNYGVSKFTKIGFVTSQLGPNQKTYDLIRSSNEYLRHRDDVDITGFWINDGPRVLQPLFSLMPLIEAYSFNGHIVATDLQSVARILSYPGPNRKPYLYYYMYDLDYLRLQQRSWDGVHEIMFHPKLRLLTRSKPHYDIVKSVFKEPFAVLENFSISQIKSMINDN